MVKIATARFRRPRPDGYATVDTGASLDGRLLAQTLVTIQAATITEPTP
jgi:hypothetical protein